MAPTKVILIGLKFPTFPNFQFPQKLSLMKNELVTHFFLLLIQKNKNHNFFFSVSFSKRFCFERVGLMWPTRLGLMGSLCVCLFLVFLFPPFLLLSTAFLYLSLRPSDIHPLALHKSSLDLNHLFLISQTFSFHLCLCLSFLFRSSFPILAQKLADTRSHFYIRFLELHVLTYILGRNIFCS